MTTATRTASPDAACADAVDLARAAAVELAGDEVGEHLGVVAEDERVVSHQFATTNPGYRGWAWSVTVVRAPRSKQVTVDEVVLLPGAEAILAPEWLPWDQRLRPGDLGVGDLMPTRPDDPRLAPTWFTGDDDLDLLGDDEAVAEARTVADELGLGRVRMLSLEGRLQAADRWYAGDGGPDAPIARSAPASCGTCGFYLPLSGSLRLAFGVCANLVTPDDGRVVSADHGCGAHSEAADDVPPLLPEPPPVLLDTVSFDRLAIEREPREEADVPAATEVPDTQPTPSPDPGLPSPGPDPDLPSPDPEPALPQPDPEPLELPEPGPGDLPEPAEPVEPLLPGLPETPGVPELGATVADEPTDAVPPVLGADEQA